MPRLCLLALALLSLQPGQLLTLEIRVFRGSEDVTGQSRVTVHRAGERGEPVARLAAGQPRAKVHVASGIYDAQAVQEQDARVVNIRWAERLVVMPYPDEGGHHLEVINLTPGYGALQIRALPGSSPIDQAALFPVKERGQPVASAMGGGKEAYLLFVVRAGQYDIQVRRDSRTSWHANIEVPLDRTRLWIVP
jgi:hypothetical protein